MFPYISVGNHKDNIMLCVLAVRLQPSVLNAPTWYSLFGKNGNFQGNFKRDYCSRVGDHCCSSPPSLELQKSAIAKACHTQKLTSLNTF